MKKKLVRYSALIKLTISNAVQNSVTFLIILWVSKLLDPSDFGVFTISISVIMMMALALDFGVSLSLVKYYNDSKKTDIEKAIFIPAAALIRLAASILLVFLAYLITITINDFRFILIFFASMTMSWWAFFRSVNQAKQNYNQYTFYTLLFSFLRVAFFILSMMSGQDSVTIFIMALYVFPPIFIFAYHLIYKKFKILKYYYFNKAFFKKAILLISYGKWIFASMLLFPLVTNIPLWLAGKIDELSSAGAYGIGIYFAGAIAPLREAIRIYMFPKIMNFQSMNDAHHYLVTIKSRLIYSLPLIFCFGGISILVQQAINGEKYASASIIIFIMISVQIVTMFTNLIGAILHFLGKPHIDTVINIFRVLLCVLLSIILIPLYGVIGAVIASSVSILAGEYLIYRYVLHQINSNIV